LLQDSTNFEAFMQQPPMPEKHTKAGGAGSSIIGILEVCESDFATNLAKEEEEEADAQADYEKVSQENKVTKTAKEQDVQNSQEEKVHHQREKLNQKLQDFAQGVAKGSSGESLLEIEGKIDGAKVLELLDAGVSEEAIGSMLSARHKHNLELLHAKLLAHPKEKVSRGGRLDRQAPVFAWEILSPRETREITMASEAHMVQGLPGEHLNDCQRLRHRANITNYNGEPTTLQATEAVTVVAVEDECQRGIVGWHEPQCILPSRREGCLLRVCEKFTCDTRVEIGIFAKHSERPALPQRTNGLKVALQV